MSKRKKKIKRTPEQMKKLREKQRKMMKVSMKKHKQNNNQHKVNGKMDNTDMIKEIKLSKSSRIGMITYIEEYKGKTLPVIITDTGGMKVGDFMKRVWSVPEPKENKYFTFEKLLSTTYKLHKVYEDFGWYVGDKGCSITIHKDWMKTDSYDGKTFSLHNFETGKTEMIRHDNMCPCGSGVKFKKCCFSKTNTPSFIKPFITRGSIVGVNGERKVEMNKDGLSPLQLDFVYGCENTLTEGLQKSEKGDRNLENLLIICSWVDKDDFYSGLMECKDGIDLDETYQEYVDMFNSNIIKVGGFTPLNEYSQNLYPDLEPYQHIVNNEWIVNKYNQLEDGGCLIQDDTTLIKDESRNGFIVKVREMN